MSSTFLGCGPALALAPVVLSCAVFAAPITHPAQMSSCAEVVNFDSLSQGPLGNLYQDKGASFTATRGLSIIDISAIFPNNRVFTQGRTLWPCESENGCAPNFAAIRISFDAPVTEVGLGWFDPNFAGNTLRAYDARGGLLESAEPALFPPATGGEAFIGIRRGAAEIAYVDVVPASGADVFTIDNVHFAGTPVITQQPSNVTSCLLGAVTLRAAAAGAGTLQWQWFKNGQPIADDDRISGSQSPALRFRRTAFSDDGSYTCQVSTACGSASTLPITLQVCAANVDDGSGTGICDGGVTIDDLLFFIFLYERGDTRADVDDGTATGTQDGGVTIDDLIFYLARYEAGC